MARTPAPAADPAAHDLTTLTVARINELILELRANRQAAVKKLADLFKERQAGIPAPAVPNDFDRLVHEETRQALNGYATADMLVLQDGIGQEQRLQARIIGIDRVIGVYGQAQLRRAAVEAQIWEQQHLPEWRAEIRGWIADALALRAREARIAALKASRGPFSLPLDRFFAGLTPLGIVWQRDPLATTIAAAIEAGVVTELEIREASET